MLLAGALAGAFHSIEVLVSNFVEEFSRLSTSVGLELIAFEEGTNSVLCRGWVGQ